MKIKSVRNAKEAKDYIIWGVVAAAANVGLFQLLILFGVDYRISNIVVLVFNRFFCYFTNKIFVFRIKCENTLILFKEILSFFLGRMISLFIDYFGVIFMVEVLRYDELASKFLVVFLVILTNYSFSKFVVFKKERRKEGNP